MGKFFLSTYSTILYLKTWGSSYATGLYGGLGMVYMPPRGFRVVMKLFYGLQRVIIIFSTWMLFASLPNILANVISKDPTKGSCPEIR
jgi:hypothetical protein